MGPWLGGRLSGVSHWLPYRSFALKACLPVFGSHPFQPNTTILCAWYLTPYTLRTLLYYSAICGLSARDGST